MNKQELINKLEKRYNNENLSEMSADQLITAAFDAYADLRMPELEKRLKMYEGSQYKTFGKIEELEEMKAL